MVLKMSKIWEIEYWLPGANVNVWAFIPYLMLVEVLEALVSMYFSILLYAKS